MRFTDTVETVKQLTIKSLIANKILLPNTYNIGTLNFKVNGSKTGSIGFEIVVREFSGLIKISYVLGNGESKAYNIELISKPSNLGNGLLWFFICPKTGKTGRKLHLFNGVFAHRTAFPDLFYEKQTYSKQQREYDFALSEYPFNVMFNKHLKTHYKGVPTKKYARLLKAAKIRDEKWFNDGIISRREYE
ncbi:hypothetical protein [Chryseobacterium turcicum]|uniref:Uncharacterized protein n=1 Tax=Chryseobacterium turcicum TaxID=2898076 RepID=A0A9Q3UZY3_9FLAO|nr:hypothetical protein [Chryseobacterium turcicum]MCD1115592.1 hypothetical protein [Chryseobacterium turcicum]